MLFNISLLLGGLVVLIAGGEFLVKGASRVALRLHISPLVVGLTIVAFGTSAPELLISLKSALANHPDMSVGNVIGSNICNLALVLGVTAVFSPIRVNQNSIKIDWPVAMGSSILLYLLVFEGFLERIEGIIFVSLLIIYIIFLIKKSRKETKAGYQEALDNGEELDIPEKGDFIHWATDFFWVILGSACLYFGSEWFVDGAKNIFLNLGYSERLIGIVVFALGTSLPELVTSISAALKKETDLAIGNLMGSNIFNILSILGITSIVTNIEVSAAIKNYDMLWMLGITLLVLPLMVINRKLGRIQGAILLCIYTYYTYSIFTF